MSRLPVIAKDLHANAADSIWVVNAYQLAVMVSLLPFASFGDIFGYRRVYRFGLVLYTAAALISATAGSLEMLILGRGLQGLGAAGLMSVNTALVRYTYPRRQLGRAIGMVSLVVSVSAASGPSIAAAILAVASWPWLFAVNVPIGIVTFILSMRLLPYTKPSEHRFDMWSAVLCALMFMCLIGGITGIGHGQSALPLTAEFAGALADRLSAGAAPAQPADAAVAGRSVPAADLRAVGHDLGVQLYRAGHRLRVAALLFPRRDRRLGGHDRADDDAVGRDDRDDGADRRPSRRPLSRRHSRRHRPGDPGRRLRAAGAAAGRSGDGGHAVAGCGVRRSGSACSSRRTTARS